jgi:hypothetical protein
MLPRSHDACEGILFLWMTQPDKHSCSHPTDARHRLAKIIGAEKEILGAKGTVLRLAGLYSLDRGAHSFWIKNGKCDGLAAGLVGLLSYEDAAGATLSALTCDRDVAGDVFVVCDGVVRPHAAECVCVCICICVYIYIYIYIYIYACVCPALVHLYVLRERKGENDVPVSACTTRLTLADLSSYSVLPYSPHVYCKILHNSRPGNSKNHTRACM